MLLTRRQAAFIRLKLFRSHRRLSHRGCALRTRLGQLAERVANQRLALLHTLVWVVAALWLLFQGIVLIDANFPLVAAERFIRNLRHDHPAFNFFMQHVRPVGGVMIIAWLRDMVNDWYKLRRDKVRATTLIKAWLAFLAVVALLSSTIRHHFIFPDEVAESTMFILTLLIMKWLSRQVTYGSKKQPDVSSRAKRTVSFVNILLKYLVRQAAK